MENFNEIAELYDYILHSFEFFWIIILTVLALVGGALFFLAKSMIKSGIDKGIDSFEKHSQELQERHNVFEGSINFRMDEYQKTIERKLATNEETISELSKQLEQLKTPPERYGLELTEDFEVIDAAEFWKNALHEVTITFWLKRNGNAPIEPGRHLICHLPQGFRPVSYTATSLGYALGHGYTEAAQISVTNRGEIWLSHSQNAITSVGGTITFLAN